MRPFRSWSINRPGNCGPVYIAAIPHYSRPADAEYRAKLAERPLAERTCQPWGCCKAMRNVGHDPSCVNSPYYRPEARR